MEFIAGAFFGAVFTVSAIVISFSVIRTISKGNVTKQVLPVINKNEEMEEICEKRLSRLPEVTDYPGWSH